MAVASLAPALRPFILKALRPVALGGILLLTASAWVHLGPLHAERWLEVVDVNGEFERLGVRDHSRLGGWAEEVIPSSPARILRKNPSDRAALWASTPGDDFFLEDPYAPTEGCRGSTLRLEAEAGHAGVSALVYWVQGDLWIDNHHALALELMGPRRIELVVFGDVHIADDLLAGEGTEIAIFALRDPEREASGRIFVGDSTWGTLERVEAHLYAAQEVVWGPANEGLEITGRVQSGPGHP